ncbi:modifier of mdg4 isoform X2 [Dendroctonus ponderosae]|uniref:modifier of mdg4 isoform X2 n=1 Tax=Dendroctonus ponderosae TaxID=77166 RepID=UPI0020366040|nr:modifier of mdg4 isoform X2 [Dendroctonus ponderosae]
MASEQFSLCWDNFHKNMSSGMNALLEHEDLVDVTLAVEGRLLKAHKMVLSVCSPYFKELFKSNPCQHPIVFMKDVSYVAMSDLLQFMYQGEVQVSQDNLTTFIKTAEALQIKGLTGDGNGSTDAETESLPEKPATRHTEESYKPMSRPKKQPLTPSVTTSPNQSAKRARLTSNDSQSSLTPITKTEPASAQTANTDSAVQFKVEPYDQNQSVLTDDDGGENMDDMLDDSTVDGAEDYSMMEGEEPQAGTSTDGTGEGQGTIYFHMATKHPKIILDENAYLVLRKEVGKTVWMCAKYFGTRSNRCKSKLVTQGRNVFVTGTHNHDPTVLEPATGLSQRVNIIRGYIYFDMATKNPKIILDEYQYLIYRKDTHKTVWMCTHYFRSKENRCKSRLVTTGRNVTVSADLHNHERSVKPERYSNMLSQVVYIIRERVK